MNEASFEHGRKRGVDASNSLVILKEQKFHEIKSNPRSPRYNVTNNLVKVVRKRT